MKLDQIGSEKIHVATNYAGSSVWQWLIDDLQAFSKARNLGNIETVQNRVDGNWHLLAWRVR